MRSFLLALSLATLCSANYIDHLAGDSRYIHSNDTIQLSLRDDSSLEPYKQLMGPSGTDKIYRLEYLLVNRESTSTFDVKYGF